MFEFFCFDFENQRNDGWSGKWEESSEWMSRLGGCADAHADVAVYVGVKLERSAKLPYAGQHLQSGIISQVKGCVAMNIEPLPRSLGHVL